MILDAANVVRWLVVLSTVFASACTYGPEERSASVSQILRLGDTFGAVVVINHEMFRRPTGLSAFPDGGKRKYSERRAVHYLVDARHQRVELLAEQDAPDELWESFQAWIVGLEGDSVAYVQLTGCPKGGECHPALQRSIVYRLSVHGELSMVGAVPDQAGLPGQMANRRPGERNYVRFSTVGDTVTARFEENGQAERLFWVHADGSLQVVGG